ncbi:hypothetical protein CCMSSC00406_0005932 [Pleurotus cornucopiae]|uniref:Uncharacterized protein n=1 Tax=Pleurotus cornucopiae TaxID=5321 RepID=A0ACB7IK70_PLECO|nr:hypothetical protein CCMSSC00406_0005932 [Pleurotus cornucopiae]
MPLPYDLCARVQNAFRARHHKIALDHNTQNLGILSILLRAGFISNLSRGTIEASDPSEFDKASESQRRIWADLKYRDDRPVLHDMELISKPSKRVFMDVSEIRLICSGRRAQKVKPLGMGEIAVVKTKNKEFEWLEAREALQLKIPGEVIILDQVYTWKGIPSSFSLDIVVIVASETTLGLEWAPSTPLVLCGGGDVVVHYDRYASGCPCTGVIAEVEKVEDLARQAKYEASIARLELKRDVGFGMSTVRLMVRKIGFYDIVENFKLSVIVEYINRDDYNNLVKFQQEDPSLTDNHIAQNLPIAWRGNEAIISQVPYQNQSNDVIDDIKRVAYEILPLSLKRRHAKSNAIERGVSYSDFSWEFPNHHEERIVRHKSAPCSQQDTYLRALRLDIDIAGYMLHINNTLNSFIYLIELNITPIPPKPPSFPSTFSSLTNLHLDAPYAAPADNIPHSSYHAQTLNISTNGPATLTGTNSTVAGTCITANGSIIILNVNGPVTGDIFSGPIYGGNVGGRKNTNHFTAPNPSPPSPRDDGPFLSRRFEFRAGLQGLFRATRRRRGEALS